MHGMVGFTGGMWEGHVGGGVRLLLLGISQEDGGPSMLVCMCTCSCAGAGHAHRVFIAIVSCAHDWNLDAFGCFSMPILVQRFMVGPLTFLAM